MAKKEQVRWNSTKKQDAENARVREIKNLVADALAPLQASVDALGREVIRLSGLADLDASRVLKSRWDHRDLDAKSDAVNHPAHYNMGGVDVIDAVEAWQLGFCPSNVVKYIARAGKKDPTKTIEDYQKARWYIDREISRLKKAGLK